MNVSPAEQKLELPIPLVDYVPKQPGERGGVYSIGAGEVLPLPDALESVEQIEPTSQTLEPDTDDLSYRHRIDSPNLDGNNSGSYPGEHPRLYERRMRVASAAVKASDIKH